MGDGLMQQNQLHPTLPRSAQMAPTCLKGGIWCRMFAVCFWVPGWSSEKTGTLPSAPSS